MYVRLCLLAAEKQIILKRSCGSLTSGARHYGSRQQQQQQAIFHRALCRFVRCLCFCLMPYCSCFRFVFFSSSVFRTFNSKYRREWETEWFTHTCDITEKKLFVSNTLSGSIHTATWEEKKVMRKRESRTQCIHLYGCQAYEITKHIAIHKFDITHYLLSLLCWALSTHANNASITFSDVNRSTFHGFKYSGHTCIPNGLVEGMPMLTLSRVYARVLYHCVRYALCAFKNNWLNSNVQLSQRIYWFDRCSIGDQTMGITHEQLACFPIYFYAILRKEITRFEIRTTAYRQND